MQVTRITPQDANDLLQSDQGHVYVDVRSTTEYEAGHVVGAVSIPLLDRAPGGGGLVPNPQFLEQVAERFDKDKPLIIGCQRGPRSLRAAEMLLATGYTNIVEMRGGYDGEIGADGQIVVPGWARVGLPTTTGCE